MPAASKASQELRSDRAVLLKGNETAKKKGGGGIRQSTSSIFVGHRKYLKREIGEREREREGGREGEGGKEGGREGGREGVRESART